MTEYYFIMNKCVKYCNIIHLYLYYFIYMNKLKYNFIEVLIMTEYYFIMNKCVKYCNIIHLYLYYFIYMNKLKYNFIEVSIFGPRRGQL